MKELGIDIETYSRVDLADCGVYRYAEDPEFRLLLFAYAIDGGEAEVVSVGTGENLPDEVLRSLTDPKVTKTAFNATFERVCLTRWMRDLGLIGRDEWLNPMQWRCTMAAALRCGLPGSLAQCGEVLGLDDRGEGKMKEGRALIRKFSCPDRKGVRTEPESDPEAWRLFMEYCKRDVEVEQAVLRKVRRIVQPKWEDHLYEVDQRINDRGVKIDPVFAANAKRMADEYTARLMDECRRLTGLENPNSPAQLKKWLGEQAGVSVASLRKGDLDDIGASLGGHGTAARVLAIRKEAGKTSVKKYEAMLGCMCSDGRIHGLLQYYGAARTGRWAGRLVQVQNLPQNHLEDLDGARAMVRAGDLDDFELNYAPMQTLSELIRTAFVAGEGRVFHVCDFSAIEARVVAWLAGEEWVLEVFRNGGDIYCATASQMFGVPVEKHGRNAELRAKGKIAVLALGYGGGVSALDAMGGSRMGLTDREMRDVMNKWRNANPRIVRLWSNIEKAAIRTAETGTETVINRNLAFNMEYGCLTVRLPSGRKIVYPRARVEPFVKRFGDTERPTEALRYEGLNQTTKKWERIETYGGKMTENIVQAIARDILATVLMKADDIGMRVVFHVHDEIIVESDGWPELEQVEDLFSRPLGWAKGLPLKGAGYTTPYYMKD